MGTDKLASILPSKKLIESNNFTEGKILLDEVEYLILNGEIQIALDHLRTWLWKFRVKTPKNIWNQFIEEVVEKHKLKTILHEDPFTHHAYQRPRGYPGDADLLDYIYFGQNALLPNNTSALGRKIFGILINDPGCQALRNRVKLIANKIDEVTALSPCRILSIACGHLREAELSQSLKESKFENFIALDQDPITLQNVNHNYKSLGIVTVKKKITSLLFRKSNLGFFDLIYTTGLFDYLSDKVAMKLIQKLFSLLADNGFLVIANALPNIYSSGYMEAFMNWKLIYRDQNHMLELTKFIPKNKFKSRLFVEPNQNFIFLEIEKICR